MKTLLIDNYDSFTFNLFQYLGEINGEPPLVVQNDKMTWPELAALAIDNIVISPGPGRPECDRDFGLCGRVILESRLPILGVCLGHQGIGHIFGGKVRSAPQAMHGRLSDIVHEGDGIFQGIPSPFRAVHYHSLIVDAELPKMLRLTAWTPDGITMALAHRSRPIWGIQFHPESICTEHGHALLANFRDFSAKAKPRSSVSVPGRRENQARSTVSSNKIPRLSLRYRTLNGPAEAEAIFNACFAASDESFWLHSALIRDGMSRFSFMGDSSGPISSVVSYRSRGRRLAIRRKGGKTALNESIFTFLERELARCSCESSDLPFQFAGGFVGYFGYELKQECGGQDAHESPTPDARFIFADRFIAFDHVASRIFLVALENEETGAVEPWFDEMEKRLTGVKALPSLACGRQQEPVNFKLRHDHAAYTDRIRAAMREIEAGESYEVCLTNELTAAISVDSFTLYRTLQRINPAPFSAYLKFRDCAVLSASPERFLHLDRNGKIETKPIKGTARRSLDAAEDERLAQQLRTDEKSRAENLMIVDLLRNDLGRVCEIGSVKVPKLMEIESYATVHQLVSTVEGVLARDKSIIDCIKSAFPGGSMTGAPKIRTMEIIDRLEGTARGVYSGAIGYLSLNGTADLSIVIRTIVAAADQLSIGVGGAIVALSDPEAEFEEIMLKAKALVHAITLAQRGTLEGDAFRIKGREAMATPDRSDGRAF